MPSFDYFFQFFSTAEDQIAVFDQEFNQVFPQARIIKPIIKPTAKGMEHPIESGATITDHVITQPREIELTTKIVQPNIADTYALIQQYFDSRTLFFIQTKAAIYENMYLLEIPHEEDPDEYDAITLILNFKQALIVNTQTTTIPAPKNPQNSDTVNRGTQQPSTPQTTTLQDIASFFKGL
jgi:hypothetical protein